MKVGDYYISTMTDMIVQIMAIGVSKEYVRVKVLTTPHKGWCHKGTVVYNIRRMEKLFKPISKLKAVLLIGDTNED